MSEQEQTYRHPDEAGCIMHPATRLLFRHWDAARGERALPDRSDIRLREIASIMQWLGILERDSVLPRYRWRLAGTGICRIFGSDLTGSVAFANWNAFERDSLVRLVDTAVATHQPCVARIRATTYGGRECGLELLCVPVRQADTDETQAFCAIAPFQPIEALRGDPLVGFELSKVRILWTDADAYNPSPLITVPHRTAGRQAGHLRVIDGGRSLT